MCDKSLDEFRAVACNKNTMRNRGRTSVVTVLIFLLAVGFCRRNLGFLFGFLDESIVNLMSAVAQFNTHNSDG